MKEMLTLVMPDHTPITEEEYNTIDTCLREGHVWVDNIEKQYGIIIIDVDGDWKHDHLRCNWLMAELGYESRGEDVLEDTGEDSYPARHYYKKVVG